MRVCALIVIHDKWINSIKYLRKVERTMAIICAICNQKQSGWFVDFPLSSNLREQRICVKCHEKLAKIEDSYTLENGKEAIEYLESYLETISIHEVKDYLGEIIFRAKNAAFTREREAEETALRKKQMEDRAAEEERIFNQNVQNIMLTTGASFDGYEVEKYIDVICKESIYKNSLWKQISASFEDFGNALSFGDREMSGVSELIANARRYVMRKFKEDAVRLNANAILGVEFESSFGSDVVRVAVSGTAVRIKKIGN